VALEVIKLPATNSEARDEMLRLAQESRVAETAAAFAQAAGLFAVAAVLEQVELTLRGPTYSFDLPQCTARNTSSKSE
jgi:hypothetical protein